MVNPVSDRAFNKKFPPMSEIKNHLKINWYRCPIEKKTLKNLSQRDDLQGFFYAIGHLSLWGALGILTFYFYLVQNFLLFFIFLFVFGTVASFLTAPHHELCHRTVFKTRRLNDLFLIIYSIVSWQNYKIYRFSHTYHHSYTLFVEGDREEVMPATPSLRVLYLLQLFTFNIFGGYQSRGLVPTISHFFNIAIDRFSNPFNSWGTELYEGYPKHRKEALNWARLVIGIHLLVFIISSLTGYLIISFLFSCSVFIANAHRYFVGVPMHCGLKDNINDFRKCARSITLDPLSEFLYWNMNWHLEHHMYAGVPHYNLKKLHKVVASDMPKPRTLLGSWQEMRKTWQKQKHDPSYAFDTPVPVTKAEGMVSDIDAMSLGGLDPRTDQ